MIPQSSANRQIAGGPVAFASVAVPSASVASHVGLILTRDFDFANSFRKTASQFHKESTGEAVPVLRETTTIQVVTAMQGQDWAP
jgi:hypothetical protein